MRNINSVESIGDFAFFYCCNLTNITIPSSVTYIGYYTFSYCGSLNINAASDSSNYSSVDGVLFNNDKTILVAYAKDNISTSYTVPDSVKTIRDYAFSGCVYLTDIQIPDSVTVIGTAAFNGCRGLTSIVLPDSITKLYSSVFSDCANLTSVKLPSGITIIEQSLFHSCSNLVSVSIPRGVTSIESHAFYGCSRLKSITIPGSVKKFGYNSFGSCYGLKDVYYLGTSEQYNEIEFAGDVGEIDYSKFHFAEDGADVMIGNAADDKESGRISADFKNITDEEQVFEAICALYDQNGTLLAYKNVPVIIAASSTENVVFEFGVIDWYSYKIFPWEDLASMRPLGAAEYK